MSVRRAPIALTAAVLAGTLVPLAAPAAAADTGPVLLDVPSVARIVLDEARGHLFLSPGRSGTGVRVTDLQGSLVTTVADLPSATGLALSPDGRSLWVALPTQSALAEVDTATLAVTRRLPVPDGQCPGDVVTVGTRLVYGHSCNTYGGDGGYGGVGVLDAATGASLGAVPGGPFYQPVVAAGPGGTVYSADAGLSPADLFAHDVAGAAPVLLASQPGVCSNLRDLSVSPDGSQVVTACGHPYEHTVYDAGLTPSGTFASGAYPLAGAWSGDGRTFAAGIDDAYGADVFVHRLGVDGPVRTADFGDSTSLLLPRGLAVSRDGTRVWAVASTSQGSPALHVLEVPPPAAVSLTAKATPGALYPGATATVTGRLATAAGAPLAGEVLRVSRSAAGSAPVELRNVTTATDGTYSFTDKPPTEGSWVYAVSHSLDGVRAQAPVLVWSTAGQLEASLSTWPTTSAPLQGSFTLSYQGPDSREGVRVTVVREAGGRRTTVATVSTDASGGGTFSDSAPAGPVRYVLTAAKHGIHPSSTATVETTVLQSTRLTAQAPGTAFAGEPLQVTGSLLGPDGPLPAGTAVSVERYGCGEAWYASATTAADGTWSVTDPSPSAGACSYEARYAGAGAEGGWYDASVAGASTSVELRATTLTVAAPGTAVAGSAVTVEGSLTSGTSALAGAPVTLTRSGCSSDWTATATTAADGSWAVTDEGVPGGTCTWEASYAESATHASSSATATTSVALQESRLTLSAVRGTGSAKKSVTLTAQLTGGSTNRTVVVTAQASNGGEVVIASAVVDSSGRVTATHTPKGTTTYRARYAGDAFFAPASAEKVL